MKQEPKVGAGPGCDLFCSKSGPLQKFVHGPNRSVRISCVSEVVRVHFFQDLLPFFAFFSLVFSF